MARAIREVPLSIKAPIVFGAFFACTSAWLSLIRSEPAAVSIGIAVVGFLFLAAGFALLGALHTERWPHAPLRMTLGIAIAVALTTMASMPIRQPSSWGSHMALSVILIIAVAANVMLTDRPRVAFVLLALLAPIGLLFVYITVLYVTSDLYGAQVKMTSLTTAIVAMACCAAVWHGRSLRRGASLSTPR